MDYNYHRDTCKIWISSTNILERSPTSLLRWFESIWCKTIFIKVQNQKWKGKNCFENYIVIVQSTVNIFGSKSGHFSNGIIRRFFFIFSKNFFCSIWWFFKVESAKYTVVVELGKIIKHSKNFGEMKKTLHFLLLFKWPLLEPKMFTVQWGLFLAKNAAAARDMVLENIFTCIFS